MAETSRVNGLIGTLGIKAPVRAASTGNVVLSGEQVQDGVALVEGDRFLAKDQVNAVENGVYDVHTGAWIRSPDFDGARDVVTGTQVKVTAGSSNANVMFEVVTANPISIGTSPISIIPAAYASVAMHSAATKATPADADELGYLDSAAGFSFKKFTWANLKAGILALFSVSGGAALVGFIQAGAGAVARTIASKLSDTVNAADFGAVGDFIVAGAINPSPTDNLAHLNAAFARSKKVRLSPGYYYLSGPLTIPRYGELLAEDLSATHLIAGTLASSVLLQPLGSDGIYVRGIRFDSVNKAAGISFGNPGGADFSSGNTFVNCAFGNSLSYVAIDKSQLTTYDGCSFSAPLYSIDGNYQTIKNCYEVWNDVSTAKALIAGVDFGAAPGSGYFSIAGIRIDSGHGHLIDNTWFEHLPSCAAYFGASVVSFSFTNNKVERVSNNPASQATIGLGWYLQVPDGSGILSGGIVSGNTFIGNVGTYSNGVGFTPDCLGILGGPGGAKCAFLGNNISFFATAVAPVGGYKVAQYRPYLSDAYAIGLYSNSGGYSITPRPAVGKVGAFIANNAGTNTFLPGVAARIEASTVVLDTEGWYTAATSRYTPAIAGAYRLSAYAWLNTMADTKTSFLALYKNGVFYRYLDRRAASGAVDVFLSGERTVLANGTDYFEVFVTQNDAGNITNFPAADAIGFEGSLAGY